MNSNIRSRYYPRRHQEKIKEKFNSSSDFENINRSANIYIIRVPERERESIKRKKKSFNRRKSTLDSSTHPQE